MSQVMSYGVQDQRPPKFRQINFRMLAIVLVFGVLVGYPVYTFIKASSNGGIEHTASGDFVDLKAIGNFAFDEMNGTLGDVPKQFRELDGKQVILDGYVFTNNSASDKINSFQFVYNVNKCCFGGPPKVQERVFAVVPNGQTIADPGMYTMVRISGIMHVEILKDDSGKVSSIYRLDVNGAKLVS